MIGGSVLAVLVVGFAVYVAWAVFDAAARMPLK